MVRDRRGVSLFDEPRLTAMTKAFQGGLAVADMAFVARIA